MTTEAVPQNAAKSTTGDGTYSKGECPITIGEQRRCSPWAFEWWLITRTSGASSDCFKVTQSSVDVCAFVGEGPFPVRFRCRACYSHKDTGSLFDDGGRIVSNGSGDLLSDKNLVSPPECG